MYLFYSIEKRELQIQILTALLERFEARITKDFDPMLSARIDFLTAELECLDA